MTLQDLKNNRNEIIELIKRETSGSSYVMKEVMDQMVATVSYTDCNFVDIFTRMTIQELGFDVVNKDAAWKSAQSDSSALYMKKGIRFEY